MIALGRAVALACLVWASWCRGEGLDAARLGVVYNLDDAHSVEIARAYAARRAVPAANVLGVHLAAVAVLDPSRFAALRAEVLQGLPSSVQSLLLVWSRPYAVGCMSITTAFAAGYRAGLCEPGCGLTERNPLYDEDGWLPADTVGWWPAFLLPADDEALARDVIRRGLAADASHPPGTLYLVSTQDRARNVRAQGYGSTIATVGGRLRVEQLTTPVTHDLDDVLGYFTGAAVVAELPHLHFRPGAVADHLTSVGGILEKGSQMSALEWLRQGASASYGSVSEPCNHPEKFPDPTVLFEHLLRGDTLLEAYWKSVAMPGQGLFIGEPLARPFGS